MGAPVTRIFKCGVCGVVPEGEVFGDWLDGYEHHGNCNSAEVYVGTNEAPKSQQPQVDVRDLVAKL